MMLTFQMAPLISILILWTVSVEARKLKQNIATRDPPFMEKHYQQLHLTKTGKPIKLECPISEPQHNIFIIWEKQVTSDHSKTPTDYYNSSHSVISYQKVVPSLVRNGRLRIKNAKVEDAGTYRCTAINGFGSSVAHFRVVVARESKEEEIKTTDVPSDTTGSTFVQSSNKPPIISTSSPTSTTQTSSSSSLIDFSSTHFFFSNMDSQWTMNKLGLILASGLVSLAGLVVLATYIINNCKMNGGPVFRSNGSDYILRRFLSMPDEHVFNHNNNNVNHYCNATTTILHRPTNDRNVLSMPAIDTIASLEPRIHNMSKKYSNNDYRVVTVQQASTLPIHHHIPINHPIPRTHEYFTNLPEQYISAYCDISQNHITPNNLVSNFTNTATSPSTFNNRTMMVNILSRFISSLNNNVINIGSRRSSVHNDRDVECGRSGSNRIYNINRIPRNINKNNHINNNCVNNSHVSNNNYINVKNYITNKNIINGGNNPIGVHRPSFTRYHWMVNNHPDIISTTTSLNSARATINISP
ncbi:hypothetical protein HELRODRAFT_183954 [Helobdella robusta]|uniref:Ig-like domain-containing protein n=1 Tax=Helobdella robusta TaxID=6412 RepID=T1FKC5_HELRO|nr:hypothetical protein HELRODRAFT_183954 [Helobdella robusta]ESO09687.1 hypothetical protein HELRODRAFT_183954 [Helobdella robusta]